MMTVMMFSWAGWGWGWMEMGRMHNAGTNTSNSQLVLGGKTEAVDMRGYAFSPGNLSVPMGATVTWTNDDNAPHNATDRGDAWQTDTIGEGESTSATFDRAGEYEYYCTIHPQMRARLVVR
jgi:plastocyanin